MAFTECKPGEEHLWPIQEEESVEAGHFVKYKLNGMVKFVELNEQNLTNPFNQQLLGRKKSESFTIERPMTKELDTIVVERIMNKYLSLHDEILEEVQDNPYSGIPLYSFTIDPENVVDSMHALLQKMMGESGSRERDRVQEELDKYYDDENSFSHVITRVYHGDYLGGYFDLSRSRKGIKQLPFMTFEGTPPAKMYALDLSSLPIIYQMHLQHGTTFSGKFIISKYVVDMIKKQLQEVRENRGEQLSVTVTMEEIRPNIMSEEVLESNVKYFTDLLNWIATNCEVKITERVLDFTRDIDIDEDKKKILKYLLNTSLLLEEIEGLTLITDDVLYYSLGVTEKKIVSSEYFAKKILPEDAAELYEFVRNKYRGFSPSLEQVNQEYTKKCAGQSDYYQHCLENLSILNNPSNTRIAVEHAKWLTLNALTDQTQLELDITNVFVQLLNGVNMPGLKQNFRRLIAEKFKLLGTKKDLALNCLENAFDIVGL